ncbi:hypothetical protein ACGFZQ_45020 [Streptomyces sp. NPDC048254]|uniref:hypothetical protein n=1 Tax=Streptomyces sp. NPDC048254 TaxID=3365525 RepID=UPI0037239DF6
MRTALMGQEDSETAMPLDAFLDEVMSILGSGGQPDEILVKAVEPVRFAEARGEYADMLRMLSNR